MDRLKLSSLAVLIAIMLVSCCGRAAAQGDDAIACDRAARDVEGEFGLPAGILMAIGTVESGRWPWTANVDGAAERYQSKAEAIEALTRVRTPRPVDVDVGCFQISLKYHPSAFATMADALDPVANARYAARFLLELRDRYGDWNRAVGAYHSATGPLEADYRDKVMANWKGSPAVEQPPVMPASEHPRWEVIAIASAVPQPAGAGALPRIITLDR